MTTPLGPAVTESFPAAVGLHELLSPEKLAAAPGAAAPAPPAPTPEVPAVEFSPKLFLKALQLLDRMASKWLKVEPETPETVEDVAGSIAPLVQYYAGSKSTVGALWGNLLVVLVGVGYMKYEKVQAREVAHGSDEASGKG